MGTLKRVKRKNVDASPNSFAINSTSTVTMDLVGFILDNTMNSADSYVHFYNESSGTVVVGTTEETFGPVLVPASAEVFVHQGSQDNKLQYFPNNITITATTTESGSASPVNDMKVEIFYYQ